ncbi:MAG: DUF1697 domain-containing protein [Bacteroidetes bacterium]|nr:DUF1697 domain-containing protein [Bacteroidota bacterium]
MLIGKKQKPGSGLQNLARSRRRISMMHEAGSNTETPEIAGSLTFEPLSTSNWDKFVHLFGDRGACGNCWCMSFRLKKAEFEADKINNGNKNRMKKLVENNQPAGILGIYKSKAISWCALAPREAFPKIENSRIHKRIDDQQVWSIPCFFIDKQYRKKGLSMDILKGVINYAREKKIGILEAYPLIPSTARLPDPFVWTGLFQSFEQAGFTVVSRISPNRPMVRYYVSGLNRYVAFLRGVNVGGKKVIKMEELNRIFIGAGYTGIKTLIQSGNVLFNANTNNHATLKSELENILRKELGYKVEVFLLPFNDVIDIFNSDPFRKVNKDEKKKFYISLFSGNPGKQAELPVFSEKGDLEVLKIKKNRAFILSREIDGKFGFPNAFIEDITGSAATTRNWNTIAKLVKE